ncbi:PucR family transcriptional regulator [Blastococcus sp. PRF04-17]|uniref:PucR family transcriptional regulator n=1 Tax=Blastococcus sp. PRF04-17 TaxID=2933797 RepID=UPI001FF5E70A|nr:helix-turn-helix domain-containing protein [Blastococcus sp. PRF04-17]UOY02876.1 helix-turn-helix domain-containing protein [Blastococcus sp. PRF04-17]
MVSEVVSAVWEQLPGYSTDRLERTDLERFVAWHVDLIITLMSAGRAPTEEEVARARDLGYSRALQGVPVESVMQSFRLAEQAVLRTLLRSATGSDPAALGRAVEALVCSFNALIAGSTASYRAAQEQVAVHYEQLERDMVADLATGGEVAAVDSRARLLGSDPDAPHIAVVLRSGGSPESTDRARRQLLAALAPGAAGRILHGAVGGVVLLLLPVAAGARTGTGSIEASVRRATQGSPVFRNVVCGIGSVAGRLAAVGESCRQALVAAKVTETLGHVGDGGTGRVAAYDDVLLEVALLSDHGVAERMVQRWLGPIMDQPHLLTTLRTFLESDLSQIRTAAALVVHPNTVAYRLGRIRELTGRDARQVGPAFELLAALRALDLMRAGAAGRAGGLSG